jgi:pimeloyl-ACP methyl ester carboxylesterase
MLEEAGCEVPQRVFVMGRSLGSAAAIAVACHHQEAIAGLIIESGFAHTLLLLARLGVVLENLDEVQDVFANLTKIGQISVPTLVIHGQADMLIPASEGVALYEGSAAPDDKKRHCCITIAIQAAQVAAGYSRCWAQRPAGCGRSKLL